MTVSPVIQDHYNLSLLFCFLCLHIVHSNFNIGGLFGQMQIILTFLLFYLSQECLIVISEKSFIHMVCLKTFLCVLVNISMFIRCLKSLRCYKVLIRQHVYECIQTYQTEELQKSITSLI